MQMLLARTWQSLTRHCHSCVVLRLSMDVPGRIPSYRRASEVYYFRSKRPFNVYIYIYIDLYIKVQRERGKGISSIYACLCMFTIVCFLGVLYTGIYIHTHRVYWRGRGRLGATLYKFATGWVACWQSVSPSTVSRGMYSLAEPIWPHADSMRPESMQGIPGPCHGPHGSRAAP